MGLVIGTGIIIGRRRRAIIQDATETFYLLTAASNNLCTAAGNRLVWRNVKQR